MRHFIAWAAAAVCLVPTAICNIWPHYQAGEGGATAIQVAFVLIMAGMPFAARHVSNPWQQAGCLLLGAGLFLWSFTNALHMGGNAQASDTSAARTIQAQASAYRAEIERLENAKAEIPKHDITGEASVNAVNAALQTALNTATAECRHGRGAICRQRETEVTEAKATQERIAAARDLTMRVDEIDKAITVERKHLTDLGALPVATDATASMLARIISVFTSTPDENAVSDWRRIGFAFLVELLAFQGPISVFAALLGRQGENRAPVVYHAPPLPQVALYPLPKGEKEGENLSLPKPSTSTPPKKAPRKRETSPEDATAEWVRRWRDARTTPAAGGSIQCSLALEDYLKWRSTQDGKGAPKLNMTNLGTIMRDSLKIDRINIKGRRHYAGIVLREEAKRPALHVVAG